MSRFLIPLALFVFLIAMLGLGLRLNPREVPSPLINKPAPDFHPTQLQAADKSISPQDLKGKVWLLNVWASWCESCRLEHPDLMELSRQHLVTIIGLNYKDTRLNGINTLRDMGDPYELSGFDVDGRVGIDYGVYGVPETYFIDRQGIVRWRWAGALSDEVLRQELDPLLNQYS